MSAQLLGGNVVSTFTLDQNRKHIFATAPYTYFLYHATQDEKIVFDNLGSFSVYLFNKEKNALIEAIEVNSCIEEGDNIQVENNVLTLHISSGSADFLVSGTLQTHSVSEGIFVTRAKDLYRVAKPWGHEIWINGQHPGYALKQVFIKAGTKTSLQYHNFKIETNVLFQGKAKLHYKSNPNVQNDNVISDDISTMAISPVSSIEVAPSTLHRLEAITDILLYETSTPHLDDVVRVQDDSKRPHGRIHDEHNK